MLALATEGILMTMTKKEQAVVDGIKKDLALERSLGWPRYEEPKPVPLPKDFGWTKDGPLWQRGWRTTGAPPYADAEEIVRNGSSFHRVESNPNYCGSRGCPPIYATKAEALKALRWAMARYCAGLLAGIDDLLQKALEEPPPPVDTPAPKEQAAVTPPKSKE
jgi:hypothetical protein